MRNRRRNLGLKKQEEDMKTQTEEMEDTEIMEEKEEKRQTELKKKIEDLESQLIYQRELQTFRSEEIYRHQLVSQMLEIRRNLEILNGHLESIKLNFREFVRIEGENAGMKEQDAI